MGAVMKAGVITFHSAHNYGASLQTWALQEALKKLGVEPCVIHYHPDIIDRLYRAPKQDTFAKKRRYLMKKRYRNTVRQQWEKYEKYQNFLQEHLQLVGDFTDYESLSSARLGLDAYITGSDQVWNSDHIGGFDPAYFLNFAEPGKRRISYAASVGRDYIYAQYRKSIQESLKDFTAISIREESTRPAIEELAGQPVSVVADPTLLLQKEDYERLRKPVERRGRYILVYMMEKNDALISFANRISITLGIPVIQRRRQRIFKNELYNFASDTPDEFLSEVEGAEFVLTNSFHGTVFSIIYEKPFISMLHTSTGSRTSDLLKSLGLEDHILYQTSQFHELSQLEIKQKEVLQQRITQLREKSYQFLQKALFES